MLAGFKGYGQSPENGAKPLVYACCAPEEDLRGRLTVRLNIVTFRLNTYCLGSLW